jgi:hypothetical protein
MVPGSFSDADAEACFLLLFTALQMFASYFLSYFAFGAFVELRVECVSQLEVMPSPLAPSLLLKVLQACLPLLLHFYLVLLLD